MLILMFFLTIAAVLGVVYLAGVVWAFIFATAAPSIVSGLVGGLAALPIWEGLKSLRNKEPKQIAKAKN